MASQLAAVQQGNSMDLVRKLLDQYHEQVSYLSMLEHIVHLLVLSLVMAAQSKEVDERTFSLLPYLDTIEQSGQSSFSPDLAWFQFSLIFLPPPPLLFSLFSVPFLLSSLSLSLSLFSHSLSFSLSRQMFWFSLSRRHHGGTAIEWL